MTTPHGHNESAALNEKASLIDLTRIPENEFERQFRSWMERDEVARSLQSKLRYDLITNFNKTNLGRRLMAETTTTNRLTLSPMVLALNTLVAEFLYAQDCHFTLSIFCTEVPFRNTLPDFENVRHFRFNDREISEIMTAICGPTTSNWNIKNYISSNYKSNANTSLLFFIMKALLDKNAKSIQKKINVGTNTRPLFKTTPEGYSSMSEEQFKKYEDESGTNFHHMNKYLIILAKKVGEMTDQFAKLQRQREYSVGLRPPRVRILKTCRQRKYEDLNRSLERVMSNLRRASNVERQNKHVEAILNAINTLANQFQKCASNFENVSKSMKRIPEFKEKIEKSTSADSLNRSGKVFTPRTTAASQTEFEEKSYSDWVAEMRYTRNGQRFLDRVEKSLRKAMEKQKRDLITESEIRLRHHCELLKIRYKQKLIEHMYFHGGENAEIVDDKHEIKESISEQFRQFELKHFDLLSKIYESEKENVTSKQPPNPPNIGASPRNVRPQEAEKNTSNLDIESLDLKLPSSYDSFDQQLQRTVLFPKNTIDMKQHIRLTVEDLVEEERNVNQIVNDAKLRIRELEQESTMLSEHFLGYLERQRKQKLEARDAAQTIWNDYINEREKMKERYSLATITTKIDSNIDNAREMENIKNQILNYTENENCNDADKKRAEKNEETNKNSSSSSSSNNDSPKDPYTNPIKKAKNDFFERERKFKEETERLLAKVSNGKSCDPGTGTGTVNRIELNSNDIELPKDLLQIWKRSGGGPVLSKNIMPQYLNDPVINETGSDLFTLWRGNPQAMTVATSTTAATRSSDLSFSAQIAPTISTTATDVRSINSGLTFNIQRPQNSGVNNVQRREVPSTTLTSTGAVRAKTTIHQPPTTLEALRSRQRQQQQQQQQQTHVPTISTTTGIVRALNKNNNVVVEEHNDFGAAREVVNVQQQRNQSDFSRKATQQDEKNNNNSKNNENNNTNTNTIERSTNNDDKNNNTDDNITDKSLSESTRETASTSGFEKKAPNPARNPVLLQSMARIQQLFNPHQTVQGNQKQQQQPQHQQQQQQTMLDNVKEEDEESASVTAPETETEQQSNKKNLIEELKKKCNNSNKNIAGTGDGSGNVLSHNKNNLQQLQQTTAQRITTTTTTAPSTITRAMTTQTTVRTNATKESKAPSKETYSGRPGDAKAITIATNIRKQQQQQQQQTAATKTSNVSSNKAVEAMPDWNQIGNGTTNESSKEKAITVKSKRHESIEREKTFESKAQVAVESGGKVIEKKDEINGAALGLSNFKVREANKQLEVGELQNNDDSPRGEHFTLVTSESSSEEVLSAGAGTGVGAGSGAKAGGGDGDAARLNKTGIRNRKSKLDIAGSESDSDFWA